MTQPVSSSQIPTPLKQGVKVTPAKHATERRAAAAHAAHANKRAAK